MPVIKIKETESFEGAMKRFKKPCEKAGILTELRRREYYDKPSIRKKKKEAAETRKTAETAEAGEDRSPAAEVRRCFFRAGVTWSRRAV